MSTAAPADPASSVVAAAAPASSGFAAASCGARDDALSFLASPVAVVGLGVLLLLLPLLLLPCRRCSTL